LAGWKRIVVTPCTGSVFGAAGAPSRVGVDADAGAFWNPTTRPVTASTAAAATPPVCIVSNNFRQTRAESIMIAPIPYKDRQEEIIMTLKSRKSPLSRKIYNFLATYRQLNTTL
jgi:hypothetical protein